LNKFTPEQKRLIEKLLNIDNVNVELQKLIEKVSLDLNEIRKVEQSIDKIVKEKTIGFPWLADAIAQYYETKGLKIAESLETKKHPALSSAEKVREVSRQRRIIEKQFRVTRNLIKYYEALFPWLTDFVGEDVDELIAQVTDRAKKADSEEDPVQIYLTPGEYTKLSPAERNQKALDRYWTRKMSSWEIGRIYERYIGYLYEKEGYSVFYQGIEAGLEDLGRDLIAKKNNEIKIIQCKNWAQHKTIHEKHICQLFGTTLKYWIEQMKSNEKKDYDFLLTLAKRKEIKGVFITSTKLSDTAKQFALELGIEFNEGLALQRYPTIKCNISKKTGQKIYHLPMDQQYDRTIVEEEKNECYVETVVEAEKLGFRRAWKWKGAVSKES
jgi:hypothetical protein